MAPRKPEASTPSSPPPGLYRALVFPWRTSPDNVGLQDPAFLSAALGGFQADSREDTEAPERQAGRIPFSCFKAPSRAPHSFLPLLEPLYCTPFPTPRLAG